MAVKIFKHDKVNGTPVSGYPDVVGYWETTYEGAVLDTRERNGYDDSDFYAVVWSEATGRVETVEYATTRGWTYLNSATVDATDEVRAKAAAYAAKLRLEDLKNRAAADARRVEAGKSVKVVKGRKVPKGTEGEVFWLGEGRFFGAVPRYRSGAWNTAAPLRAGLRTADGTVYWTAASNLEVTDPEEYLPDLTELERRAAGTDFTYVAARAAALTGMAYL